jgi:hypothetical protein
MINVLPLEAGEYVTVEVLSCTSATLRCKIA